VADDAHKQIAHKVHDRAQAHYEDGNRFFYGEGVLKDYEEAARFYSQAASQGHVEAQFFIAYCYHYGLGVAQSYENSAPWYRRYGLLLRGQAEPHTGLPTPRPHTHDSHMVRGAMWCMHAGQLIKGTQGHKPIWAHICNTGVGYFKM
jgi:hypothetical protein